MKREPQYFRPEKDAYERSQHRVEFVFDIPPLKERVACWDFTFSVDGQDEFYPAIGIMKENGPDSIKFVWFPLDNYVGRDGPTRVVMRAAPFSHKGERLADYQVQEFVLDMKLFSESQKAGGGNGE